MIRSAARFDAVVFDMDGVLVDSEPLHHAVLNRLLGDEDVPPLGLELYRLYLGASDEDTWRDLTARFGLRRPIDEYRALYDAAMREAYRTTRPRPGARALLARLRAEGLRLGLASSSRAAWVTLALETFALADAFDAAVTGDDVRRAKPDPEIYLACAARLGVPAARCLAVEDAPRGVAAARAAGMTVLALRTGYVAEEELRGAAHIIEDLASVAEALVTI